MTLQQYALLSTEERLAYRRDNLDAWMDLMEEKRESGVILGFEWSFYPFK